MNTQIASPQTEIAAKLEAAAAAAKAAEEAGRYGPVKHEVPAPATVSATPALVIPSPEEKKTFSETKLASAIRSAIDPTMAILTLIVLGIIGYGFYSYATGYVAGVVEKLEQAGKTAVTKAVAAKEAELEAKFVKQVPLEVGFENGHVEGKGWWTNHFFRSDPAKVFTIGTIIDTGKDGKLSLAKTTVTAKAGNGKVYNLKEGTADTWILQVDASPTPPAAKK